MKKLLVVFASILLLTACQIDNKTSENLQTKIFSVYCENNRLIWLHKISSSSDFYKDIADRNGTDVVSQSIVAWHLLWEYVLSWQQKNVRELRGYTGKDFDDTIEKLLYANDGIVDSFEKLKKIRSFTEFQWVMSDYVTYYEVLSWIPRVFKREADSEWLKVMWAWSLLEASLDMDMCNNKIWVWYWDNGMWNI